MTAILVLVLSLLTRPVSAQEPDLVLDMGVLGSQIRFDAAAFADDACELQPIDHCVDAPGGRRLLRFSVQADNMGTADLVLGVPPMIDPPNGGEFVYSACHMHYHFETFGRYELRPRGGTTPIKEGQKRSFCVEDTRPAPGAIARICTTDADCAGSGRCNQQQNPHICRYDCTYQGIQVGWGDLYPSTLDCQWIDITDVAPGDYDVCVFLNTAQLIPESNYDDDSGCAPVTIEGPSALHPAPTVKVHAPRRKAKARVGRPLTIAWQKHIHGGGKHIKVQEVWFSPDGGTSYQLIAGALSPGRRSFRWKVPAGSASDTAMIRVIVWSTDLQRGIGLSVPFRIMP
jgi:Lysyl oxidase